MLGNGPRRTTGLVRCRWAKIACGCWPGLFEKKRNGVNPPNAVAQVEAIGVKEIVEGEYRFARVRPLFEDVRAAGSGQQTTGDGRRSPDSVFRYKDVVYGALGELTLFIEKERVIASFPLGGNQFVVIEGAIRRFVKEKAIAAGNRSTGNPHAA